MAARDFANPEWLRETLLDVLSFYFPTGVDERHGGYLANLDAETGEIYDHDAKHLVASCRYVANFGVGELVDGPDWCRPAAARGVDFLQAAHRDPATGGYDWLLSGTESVERRRVCYGHAFALLAYARAAQADVPGAVASLEAVFDVLMEHFWEPEHGLCKSEFDPAFETADPYRGQNANMHTCEAMLAAFEATGEARYLDRAREIAHALTVDLAAAHDGLLWEHYTAEWDHDLEYNRDEPDDLFRPWGYQPGHHVEWAKLLAVLDRRADTDWALDRAEGLFAAAIEHGWDEENGGFYYTFDREGEPIVDDKYGWPIAEGIGAAAALFERTGEATYREWYDRQWGYARANLTAPGGNWYERLTVENEPIETGDEPAVEPGYHPIGACFEALRSFGHLG